MKIADADILLVAGLGGSGPDHWQQRWLKKMPNGHLVTQQDWDHPDLIEWTYTLERAIIMATRPVVLIGHSLGVSTIVHTAKRLADTKVRGAFLVSAPDLETNVQVPAAAQELRNVPRDPLAFPSLLIASSDDPLCSLEKAADHASCWGSEFHDAGPAGHINIASGHGPWPEGLMMFSRLMKRVQA